MVPIPVHRETGKKTKSIYFVFLSLALFSLEVLGSNLSVSLQTAGGAPAGGQASRGATTRGEARSASPAGTPTHRQEQFRVRLDL
jgi:hypothetical protein